jgi:uncharacterized repeat protein (TIGR03803 family)
MRNVVSIACVLILANCSHGNAPLLPNAGNGVANSPLSPPGVSYKVLYSFAGQPGGALPRGPLTSMHGTLHGTTDLGGAHNWGTFFGMSPAGKVRVLYSFGKNGADGRQPNGLTDLNGVLYGTTFSGGDQEGDGTVFAVGTFGKETVLYTFGGGKDGATPEAELSALNGTLYGTTNNGGASQGNGFGTVFAVSTSGKERVLYRFKGGSDGEYPEGGLLDVKGALYGTTFGGGLDSCSPYGCGTVFSVTLGGKKHIVYSFKGGADGASPEAALISLNGNLYGTTFNGGTHGRGTVFAVSTTGKERVAYSFKGGTDGAGPIAPLVAVNGVLYGTTYGGGLYNCASSYSCGTVFSLTTAGRERVLHRFGNVPDGALPRASLFAMKGVLYGTTSAGGSDNQGIVFQIIQPSTVTIK